MNAERILIASEAIGDGRWLVERAARYATQRVVFGKPIGANQGVQFPIAQAYAHVEAAALVRDKAAAAVRRGQALRRRGEHGEAAGVGGLLGGRERLHDAHGGYGFAAEYDVERKFREARLSWWRPSTTTWSWPSSASTSSACLGATSKASESRYHRTRRRRGRAR